MYISGGFLFIIIVESMNNIKLQNTLPQIFADQDSVESEIWHSEVSFTKGDIALIQATSGSGKSSLCSYIYGYRADYQGLILFDDKNIRSLNNNEWQKVREYQLSIVFQELRLFEDLTVLENIEIKNKITQLKKRKEIIQMLEMLDLGDKINAKVKETSLGQQQRVALIRALCQPFDFILLDEPISHLDAVNSRLATSLLLQEVKRQGAGVIVTSLGHQLELPYTHNYNL